MKFLSRVMRVYRTYQWLDVLQDDVAGEIPGQILAKLRDQLSVTFILLTQQIELLLFVTTEWKMDGYTVTEQ